MKPDQEIKSAIAQDTKFSQRRSQSDIPANNISSLISSRRRIRNSHDFCPELRVSVVQQFPP
eukprot:749460-Hanusia_phi.AAC.1